MNRCETIHPIDTTIDDLSVALHLLSKEQRASMPEEAQVALAITEIDTAQEILAADELTTALVTRSGLDKEAVIKANRKLLQMELIEREGFSEPGSKRTLRLFLNETGYKFLDEALGLALNHES